MHNENLIARINEPIPAVTDRDRLTAALNLVDFASARQMGADDTATVIYALGLDESPLVAGCLARAGFTLDRVLAAPSEHAVGS